MVWAKPNFTKEFFASKLYHEMTIGQHQKYVLGKVAQFSLLPIVFKQFREPK